MSCFVVSVYGVVSACFIYSGHPAPSTSPITHMHFSLFVSPPPPQNVLYLNNIFVGGGGGRYFGTVSPKMDIFNFCFYRSTIAERRLSIAAFWVFTATYRSLQQGGTDSCTAGILPAVQPVQIFCICTLYLLRIRLYSCLF